MDWTLNHRYSHWERDIELKCCYLQRAVSGPDDSNLFVWDIFLQPFASFHFVTVLFVLQENIWITNWIWPHRWHQVGKLPIPWHQLQWSRKRDKGSSAPIPRSCRLFGSFFFSYWIHLRDWHGGDGQHHDLFAGLVSVKGRPRIPLFSESIFEVAVFLKKDTF